MIRILHIIHSLTVGGAARTMIATAKYSARLGPYEHVLAILNLQATDPSAIEFAQKEGMKIAIARNREEICREIEAADIVQINWWQHPEMDEFLRSPLPPCRLLGWFHCAGDSAPQVVTKELVALVDLALGGSSYTHLGPGFFALPEEERLRKTDYVVGGADFERLRNVTRQPHEGFNVGYVGTVNFVKLHPDFINLCAGVRLENCRFIVCGGNMQAELAHEAEKLRLATRFDFRGYVADVPAVLSLFDVYGYPLCEDTYAASELNLQEAMYVGIPPVVFPHGGIKTLVMHEYTGLVAHSPREYQQAIEHLYHYPLERDRLGENAREFARQMFGAENHAPKMIAMYTHLLEQPKRAHEYRGKPSTGNEFFLSSLDGLAPAFEQAAAAKNLDELLEAEDQIARSSHLMRCAGILPYVGHYPNDALLQMWSGLARFGAGEPAAAAEHFVRAHQLGLPSHAWRIFWYLALSALHCDDRDLALECLNNTVALSPHFGPAQQLLERLAARDLKPRNRSLLAPELWE